MRKWAIHVSREGRLASIAPVTAGLMYPGTSSATRLLQIDPRRSALSLVVTLLFARQLGILCLDSICKDSSFVSVLPIALGTKAITLHSSLPTFRAVCTGNFHPAFLSRKARRVAPRSILQLRYLPTYLPTNAPKVQSPNRRDLRQLGSSRPSQVTRYFRSSTSPNRGPHFVQKVKAPVDLRANQPVYTVSHVR